MWSRRFLQAMRRAVSSCFAFAWQAGFLVAGWVKRSTAQHWSSDGAQRVLVISPHPDDEAIACSGTIVRHLESGDEVVVAIATDGRLSRNAPSPDEMAKIRKSETKCAASGLGIERLEWLGLPEGNWAESELVGLLSELFERYSPTVVYAPSRIDFHPEHLAVAHALACALDSFITATGKNPVVRIYQVQVPLTQKLTNLVVDISGGIGKSNAALQAYRSQAGSIRFVDRRRRYSARSHRASGPVEEFWELLGDQYVVLHRGTSGEWAGKFRGIRPFAWTDPLAYFLGNNERRRLRLLAANAYSAVG